MSNVPSADFNSQKSETARDMQLRLYREIGISAVAAALRFTTQPDPAKPTSAKHPLPPVFRNEEAA